MDQSSLEHRAGYVSIVGKPNVGKSTLMNALLGQKLSIVTYKAQTTRNRVMGILNGENFQLIYSDTPGLLLPKYTLHQRMMRMVNVSLEDADALLYVVEPEEEWNEVLLQKLKHSKFPVFLIINKIDLVSQDQLIVEIDKWSKTFNFEAIIPVSAKRHTNLDLIIPTLLKFLPVHPPYFPKDEISSNSERFFAAEIIREKIFLNYDEEIPYCCQVIIQSFKEEKKIIRIYSEIYVERESQKGILIGKKGESLKKLGIDARKGLEDFFQKKIFLETIIKVEPDWRKNEKKLDQFGY